MEKLFDDFNSFVNELDDEEKDQLMDLLSDPDSIGLTINKNYYVNNSPDYKSIAKPVAKWLLPLWRIDTDRPQRFKELLQSIYDEGAKLDQQQRMGDMHNYAYCIMADFSRFRHTYCWRLWGLLWLLEKEGDGEGTDIILEFLHQDYFFIDRYFSLDFNTLPAVVLAVVGQDRMLDLYDFLVSTGIVPDSKPVVFEAIACIAAKIPSKRLEAVHFLLKYLNYVYEISMEGANMQNMETYVEILGKYSILEAIPVVRKIYEEADFMHVLIVDADDAQETIENSDGSDDEFRFDSVDQAVDTILSWADEDPDFWSTDNLEE